MNFDQLRYFKIAAEEENLGRASQKLHITQQGLSANIIKLENELGVYLFDRIGRQIFLSEQGKIFLRYTDMILQDLQSAEDALQSNLEEKQRTIAVSTTGANLASLLISGYLSCHNGTNIILNIIAEKYIPFALAQHNVNFVVTSVPYNSPETDSIVLYEQPFVVLASKNHPLSERTEISLEELKNEKMALSESSEPFRKDLDVIFNKAGFHPNVVLTSNSANTMITYVMTGQGVTIFGRTTRTGSQIAPYGDQIAVIPISDPFAKRNIYMHWRKETVKEEPHLLEFLAYAKENGSSLFENPLM